MGQRIDIFSFNLDVLLENKQKFMFVRLHLNFINLNPPILSFPAINISLFTLLEFKICIDN
jgi:hypothetical protein